MIIRLTLAVALTFLYVSGYAQNILLEKEVTDEVFNKQKGPNLKKFDHLYVVGNFYFDTGDEVEVKPILSNDFGFGYRYKYKLLSFYSVGFNLSFHRLNFNLPQEDGKRILNDIENDKERLVFTELDLELYQRFQIGKTGNMIGFFVDMGAYGGWIIGSRNIIRDEISGNETYPANVRVVRYKNLDYTENLAYGLKVRIGYNNIAISGKYRLSDLFKSDYNITELPHFAVGLEIGLH